MARRTHREDFGTPAPPALRYGGDALPDYAPPVVAAAVAATFLPGIAGISGGVLAASLLMAYAISRLAAKTPPEMPAMPGRNVAATAAATTGGA